VTRIGSERRGAQCQHKGHTNSRWTRKKDQQRDGARQGGKISPSDPRHEVSRFAHPPAAKRRLPANLPTISSPPGLVFQGAPSEAVSVAGSGRLALVRRWFCWCFARPNLGILVPGPASWKLSPIGCVAFLASLGSWIRGIEAGSIGCPALSGTGQTARIISSCSYRVCVGFYACFSQSETLKLPPLSRRGYVVAQ
jgi:hypothetical protein